MHAKSHGKKFQTFKEWNRDGYSWIVQDMIGYANYVDKQRKEDVEGDTSTIPEPVTFEKGSGGLPLLPLEVKGVRGSEIAKHAQEIIRAYFLRHYRNVSIICRIDLFNNRLVQSLQQVATVPGHRGLLLVKTHQSFSILLVFPLASNSRTLAGWE